MKSNRTRHQNVGCSKKIQNKTSLIKKSSPYTGTRASVSGKLGAEEVKAEDTEMIGAEYPKIRRTKLDKFMDEFFNGTERTH